MLNERYYTIKEVCEAVGLSRSRLYQLMGSAFPYPVYLLKSRRPAFTEEQFQIFQEVRRSNQGVDGMPVMFYSKRSPGRTRQTIKKKVPKIVKPSRHAEAIEALAHLGLTDISGHEIDDALAKLSLVGSDSKDGKVIGRLFRFFKAQNRQNPADNDG
jgi:predicted DNA-binding transcriptional regulator AlpA